MAFASSSRLRAALSGLWRHKWLLIVPVVVSTVTSLAVVHFTPVRYESAATLVVVPSRVLLDLQTSAESVSADRLHLLTAQILSRTRLERLIDQYGLYKDDGLEIMQERVDRMRQDIAIEFAGDEKAPGRFITVAFHASDPKVAQRVASEVAGYVVSQSTVDMMSANDGTLQFLTAMIEEAKRKLDQFDQAHPAGHAESRSAAIEREVLEEGYRSLLRRRQDASIVSAIDNRQFGEQLKVIDPAHIPERPTGLSHAQMTGAGVLGGLLVGLVLVGVSSKRA